MSVEIANNTTINAPTGGVFRFKFDRDINSILQRFASVHHGDDLEDFKDAWDVFLSTYRTAIDIETQRLKEIGYNGDVENKMLTSVRYYYCKQFKIGNAEKKDRHVPNEEAPVQEAPVQDATDEDANTEDTQTKRKYVKINKDVHDAIDKFLKKDNNYTLKPAAAWSEFCQEHNEDFCPKKTFKNRIYNYREKIRNQNDVRQDTGEDDGFGIGVNFDV